ncbi:hypothetical protein OY671_010389, partial [Metschnikowia pulcherrima]
MRQVGGVVTRRDAPGSHRAPLDPLPASAQRQALDRSVDRYSGPQASSSPPGLQRRSAPDFLESQEADSVGRSDVSVAELQSASQRSVSAPSMSEGSAERSSDNRDKTTDREAHPSSPQEVHQRSMQAIWMTPVPKHTVPAQETERQRNLQREHVNRLAAMWL